MHIASAISVQYPQTDSETNKNLTTQEKQVLWDVSGKGSKRTRRMRSSSAQSRSVVGLIRPDYRIYLEKADSARRVWARDVGVAEGGK